MRVLWLARQIPLPLTSGDRIYTARLVESVARAGCSIAYLGLEAPNTLPASQLSAEVDWRTIPGGQGSQIPFLVTPSLPMVGVRHRTPAYRRALRDALAEGGWDAIVLDQYGMVWCLDEIAASGFSGVLAHVSHDFETKVIRDVAKAFSGNPLKKALLLDNARRTALAERRLATACRLVAAITDEDQAEFRRIGAADAYVTLTPGYVGPSRDQRTIGPQTPRRVVMLGSFDWLPKRLNLIAFLKVCHERFRQSGIELRIVGAASRQLRDEVAPYEGSVRMLGFVDDPAEELGQARLALVFEETGGGFKLKMLDYIFNRVPLFGLDRAITGLPPSVRAHVATAGTMTELVELVVAEVDSINRLNAMQDGAYRTGLTAFSWDRTGKILADGLALASRTSR